MDSARFHTITRLFGERRASRRVSRNFGTIIEQEGTPESNPGATGTTLVQGIPDTSEPSPEFLFVQSFESGSIAAMDGEAGRYTVTLQQGLGQTLYFSDRPERIVGATPTPQFLGGLGFLEDNPPNAALVIDDGKGGTNLAVVELFHPLFDPVSPGVSYDIVALQDYTDTTQLSFTEVPLNLEVIPSTFGSAHLFIDDCPETEVTCFSTDSYGTHSVYRGSLGTQDTCWYWGEASCITCGSGGLRGAVAYWSTQCNNAFTNCGGDCRANQVCASGLCWAPSLGT